VNACGYNLAPTAIEQIAARPITAPKHTLAVQLAPVAAPPPNSPPTKKPAKQ
jgi:hypothetical protein